MELKPIRTAVDYDAALHRIEALWRAAHGTPDGDELDVLITSWRPSSASTFPSTSPTRPRIVKINLLKCTGVFRATQAF
jgi:HTH-type transcriptional regulator / antitoxin HigA